MTQSKKPRLLLLHGALGSAKTFDAIRSLLEKDFDIYSPDLRWHGTRTEEDKGFEMKDLVDDLNSLLASKPGEAWWCFGYSMGAYVAMSLALRKPGFFRGIMSLGTKLDWHPEQAAKEAAMLQADKIIEKVPAFAAQLEAHHGKPWEKLCQQTANMMRALGDNPLLSPEVAGNIQVPVCIGLGDRDKMVSLKESWEFYQKLTQGSFQSFPHTAHAFDSLDPELFQVALSFFIRKNSR